MGAAASAATAVTRSFGARDLLDEMPPLRKCKQDMGAAAPAASGDGEGIDVLPDGVLAHILGFLPAEEAVRTSVLARRWRYLWMSATGLHVAAADGKFLGTAEKLVEFGDLLLAHREGASLDTCELEVGKWHIDDEVCRRLSIWFRHAVMCRVRFLRFRILCNNDDCFISPCHEFEDLPLVSQHLKRLELSGVELGSSLLDFSSCPALEHLVFTWCGLSMPTEKISLEFPKSLKYLIMTGCAFNFNSRILIYAPSLLSLCLDNFFGRAPVIGSMPSLVQAFVRITSTCYDFEGNGGASNDCVLLKGLLEARNLTLISEPSRFIFRMDMRCCPTFSKLKNLLLNDYWCVPDDFCTLACILEHSPVLEKLTLQHFSERYIFHPPPHKVQLQGSFNTILRCAAISKHLKTVVIECEVVDQKILKVLKFLRFRHE